MANSTVTISKTSTFKTSRHDARQQLDFVQWAEQHDLDPDAASTVIQFNIRRGF